MKTIVDGRHWGLDGRYSWSIRETDSPSGPVYYYWQVSRAAGAVIARGPASSLEDAKSRVHAVVRLMRVK